MFEIHTAKQGDVRLHSLRLQPASPSRRYAKETCRA
jgi:hypothetical protein